MSCSTNARFHKPESQARVAYFLVVPINLRIRACRSPSRSLHHPLACLSYATHDQAHVHSTTWQCHQQSSQVRRRCLFGQDCHSSFGAGTKVGGSMEVLVQECSMSIGNIGFLRASTILYDIAYVYLMPGFPLARRICFGSRVPVAFGSRRRQAPFLKVIRLGRCKRSFPMDSQGTGSPAFWPGINYSQ